MNTQEAIQILISHDMLEEAEKLERIAEECECVDCKKDPSRSEWLSLEERLEVCREKVEAYQTQNFNLTQENLRLKREIASHAQQAKIKEDL